MADDPVADEPVCVPPPYSMIDPQLPLPADMLLAAAADAVEHCPANAPLPGAISALEAASQRVADVVGIMAEHLMAIGQPLPEVPEPVPMPLRIALLTSMWWGSQPRTLTVSFMDSPQPALRAKIIAAMNLWRCGVKFAETSDVGQVRIARQNTGYWSYLGRSILQIPPGQPTFNLQGFTLNTPESEWLRVPTHEAGHTLGCPHEHARQAIVDLLDREAVIADFMRTQGWSRSEVIAQVFTPISEASLMGTPADVDSIMAYMFAARLTKNRVAIPGGPQISDRDRGFILKMYPVEGTVTPTPTPTPTTPTPTTPTPTPTPGVLTYPTPPSTREGAVTIGGQKFIVSTTTTVTLTPR